MTTVTVSKQELKATVRESVREAMEEALSAWRGALLPFVSPAEQKDIERRYKRPSHKAIKSRNLSL